MIGLLRTSNCLVWAARQYVAHGGYVIALRSSYGWWPHFVWSPDLITYLEFAPPVKTPRWSPPWIFRGTVQPWHPHAPGSHDGART